MGGAIGSIVLPQQFEGTIPDDIDVEMFKIITGPYYSTQLFNSLKSVDTDHISRIKLQQLTCKCDVLLSYDCEFDDDGRDNRERVFRINDRLKNCGILTWYHDDIFKDSYTEQQLIDGLNNSAIVIVFLTKRYLERLRTHDNLKDSCRLQFKFADLHKTPDRIIPVVMDKYSSDKSNWVGPATSITNRLIVDFSRNEDEGMHFEETTQHLIKYIKSITTPLLRMVYNPKEVSILMSDEFQLLPISGTLTEMNNHNHTLNNGNTDNSYLIPPPMSVLRSYGDAVVSVPQTPGTAAIVLPNRLYDKRTDSYHMILNWFDTFATNSKVAAKEISQLSDLEIIDRLRIVSNTINITIKYMNTLRRWINISTTMYTYLNNTYNLKFKSFKKW